MACLAVSTSGSASVSTASVVLLLSASLHSRMYIYWSLTHSLLLLFLLFSSTPCSQAVLQPSLGDGCVNIFLDLGSNVGVQVRKFFEPKKYTSQVSQIMEVFAERFGRDRRGPTNCVFSFEPNPKHTPQLQRIETVYRALGYRHLHFPMAVSSENTTLTLLRAQNNQFDADAHLIKNREDLQHQRLKAHVSRANTTVTATVVDFVEFLRVHVLARQLPTGMRGKGQVVIKMDIEGEEYNLLPHLITSGVLCQSTDLLLIEWHIRNSRWFLKGVLPLPIVKEKVVQLQKSMSMLLALSRPSCKTELRKIDDESFSHDSLDTNPLPPLPRS